MQCYPCSYYMVHAKLSGLRRGKDMVQNEGLLIANATIFLLILSHIFDITNADTRSKEQLCKQSWLIDMLHSLHIFHSMYTWPILLGSGVYGPTKSMNNYIY